MLLLRQKRMYFENVSQGYWVFDKNVTVYWAPKFIYKGTCMYTYYWVSKSNHCVTIAFRVFLILFVWTWNACQGQYKLSWTRLHLCVMFCLWYKLLKMLLIYLPICCAKTSHSLVEPFFSSSNKSNSMAGTMQVEANLQTQLNDHLHFRKLKCCKTPGI